MLIQPNDPRWRDLIDALQEQIERLGGLPLPPADPSVMVLPLKNGQSYDIAHLLGRLADRIEALEEGRVDEEAARVRAQRQAALEEAERKRAELKAKWEAEDARRDSLHTRGLAWDVVRPVVRLGLTDEQLCQMSDLDLVAMRGLTVKRVRQLREVFPYSPTTELSSDRLTDSPSDHDS
jgi:hypothetical protein